MCSKRRDETQSNERQTYYANSETDSLYRFKSYGLRCQSQTSPGSVEREPVSNPTPTIPPPPVYTTCLARGTRLLELTKSDNPTQSDFLDASEFDKWGYVRTPTTNDLAYFRGNFPSLFDTLCEETNVPTDEALASGSVDRRDHTKAVTVDGAHYPPTTAYFMTMMSSELGLLIAYNNVSPAEALYLEEIVDQPTPKLERWSDAAFLQWIDSVPEDKVKGIKFVLRQTVVNDDTIEVIAHIMKQHGPFETPYPEWPGVEVEIESDDGKALLGTPNGRGIAWILAQHREALRWKIPTKITIFQPESCRKYSRSLAYPSLLFRIADFTPEADEGGEEEDDDDDDDEDMISLRGCLASFSLLFSDSCCCFPRD